MRTRAKTSDGKWVHRFVPGRVESEEDRNNRLGRELAVQDLEDWLDKVGAPRFFSNDPVNEMTLMARVQSLVRRTAKTAKARKAIRSRRG